MWQALWNLFTILVAIFVVSVAGSLLFAIGSWFVQTEVSKWQDKR